MVKNPFLFFFKKELKFLKKYFLEICLDLFNYKLLKLKNNKNLNKWILIIKNILKIKKLNGYLTKKNTL